MKTLVVYDISDDPTRNKVFQACKDYGLSHIQYSAFFGDLNHNRRQELCLRLRQTLKGKDGKIVVCPVCDKDLALVQEIIIPEMDSISPITEVKQNILVY